MGVPTSEVGYTPAMPRREEHEVHKRHVVALEKKKKLINTSANSLYIKFNVNTICKQYGIPQCVHCLNVPVLCFHIWPDDGSFEPKNFAEFLIIFTNICCVIVRTNLLYHINASSVSRFVPRGQTDVTKQVVAFRNFCKSV